MQKIPPLLNDSVLKIPPLPLPHPHPNDPQLHLTTNIPLRPLLNESVEQEANPNPAIPIDDVKANLVGRSLPFLASTHAPPITSLCFSTPEDPLGIDICKT
jgi:hypothetical protein